MQPVVKPLSYTHRSLVFILLAVIFMLSLPAFIFYGAGYRYSFFSGVPTVTATGGLYIASDLSDSKIFLNELEVTNARVFRKASYIQGIEPGLHRVHVQVPNSHTWVKNLRVYPQIVTEAEAFNLPLVPQVRPVTEYITQNKEAVFVLSTTTATNTDLFLNSSSSIPYIVTTEQSTTTYSINSEFELLLELFTEKASSTARRQMYLEEKNKVVEKFGFATTTPEVIDFVDEFSDVSTTTITKDRLELYELENQIFVRAVGEGRQVPHYFCTSQLSSILNEEFSIFQENILTANDTEESILSASYNNGIYRICRTNIRIDNQNKLVHDFDFFPNNSNLILMHLEDGVYVTEIDDRAWQNSQLLYPGEDLVMLVRGNGIFIKEGENIFEVLTSFSKS